MILIGSIPGLFSTDRQKQIAATAFLYFVFSFLFVFDD